METEAMIPMVVGIKLRTNSNWHPWLACCSSSFFRQCFQVRQFQRAAILLQPTGSNPQPMPCQCCLQTWGSQSADHTTSQTHHNAFTPASYISFASWKSCCISSCAHKLGPWVLREGLGDLYSDGMLHKWRQSCTGKEQVPYTIWFLDTKIAIKV